MDDLLEAFPQLSPAQAEEIAFHFDQWMEGVGESFIDYEREWAARIGFAAGYLQRQKERADGLSSR